MKWFKRITALPDKWLNRAKEDAAPTEKWKISVYPEHMESFRQQNGAKALAGVLSKLGKYQPYYNILTSELGQYLLGDAISQCNYLLMKIADNTADINEKAEYRAYRKILGRQMERIHSYISAANKVRGA